MIIIERDREREREKKHYDHYVATLEKMPNSFSSSILFCTDVPWPGGRGIAGWMFIPTAGPSTNLCQPLSTYFTTVGGRILHLGWLKHVKTL
jgi:hypothetical protein